LYKWLTPCAVDGNGESRDPAASAANGPALSPTDDKVGAETKADDSVEVLGDAGLAKLYRR
jgi:hypothetical protein